MRHERGAGDAVDADGVHRASGASGGGNRVLLRPMLSVKVLEKKALGMTR